VGQKSEMIRSKEFTNRRQVNSRRSDNKQSGESGKTKNQVGKKALDRDGAGEHKKDMGNLVISPIRPVHKIQ